MSSTSLAQDKGWPSFMCAIVDRIETDIDNLHKGDKPDKAMELLKKGKLLVVNAAMETLQQDTQRTFSMEIHNGVPTFRTKPKDDQDMADRIFDSGGRSLQKLPSTFGAVVRFITWASQRLKGIQTLRRLMELGGRPAKFLEEASEGHAASRVSMVSEQSGSVDNRTTVLQLFLSLTTFFLVQKMKGPFR